MIKIEIISVRNPCWASEDHSAINCLVRTNNLNFEAPFMAMPNDAEAHGREIYARCLNGEFGEIAPMKPRSVPAVVPQIHPTPEQDRLQRFLDQANLENHRKSFRSVVIVWGSLLDNLLDEVLERYARSMMTSGGRVEKPPRTFDARINQALRLCLINDEQASKLHHIRRVRNAAAHDWELSLDSKDILPSLRGLYDVDHAGFLAYHEDLDFLIQLVYAPSCGLLAISLMSQPQ